MKDEKIDFSEFTDTSGEEYLARVRRKRILYAVNTYFVCPVTLLCMLLGTLISATDTVKRLRGEEIHDKIGGDTEEKIVSLETEDEVTETEKNETEDEETKYIYDIDNDISSLLSKYYSEKVETDDIYDYDYSLVEEGYRAIVPLSLSRPTENGAMYVSNTSKYSFDYKDYENRELKEIFDEDKDGDSYYALVIHTHGTEAYTPEGVVTDSISEPYNTRSDDNEKNVVSVGAVFASELEKCGIKTLHYDVAIDKESYTQAYANAAVEIKKLLKQYPTIKYVFDVHRDGVTLSSGEKVKAVCKINGKPAAQVMFVVGTDTLGQKHDSWQDNLTLAVKLQLRLEKRYKNFTRPISIKQGAYNQHYSSMGLLIEFGSDGNTLAEAKYSAKLLARELASLMKGEESQ